jgi:hypothetical protein
MFNWENQQYLINNHDNFYHNPNNNAVDYFNHLRDTSCTICFLPPVHPYIPDRFRIFWNWFTNNSSALSYSRITCETLNLYLNTRRNRTETLDRLLQRNSKYPYSSYPKFRRIYPTSYPKLKAS